MALEDGVGVGVGKGGVKGIAGRTTILLLAPLVAPGLGMSISITLGKSDPKPL